jgi:glutathione S-transferase
MSQGKYRLYGRENAGSLAVQMVLEEIGAPYELTFVSKSDAQLGAYRRINPAGKIPALVLPDGTAVSESAAILIHLCGAHPAARLAPEPGSAAHARFLQWMVYLSANLYDTALRYYYAERYSNAATAAAGIQAQALSDFSGQLEFVSGALSPYVLGESLSAADPYLYMLAGWYPEEATAPHKRLPQLARHAELMRRRPATIKADKAHAPSP